MSHSFPPHVQWSGIPIVILSFILIAVSLSVFKLAGRPVLKQAQIRSRILAVLRHSGFATRSCIVNLWSCSDLYTQKHPSFFFVVFRSSSSVITRFTPRDHRDEVCYCPRWSCSDAVCLSCSWTAGGGMASSYGAAPWVVGRI